MAIEGKVAAVIKSKYDNGGFGIKLEDGKWYNSKDRREGVFEPGHVIKFNTVTEGKNTWINQVKVLAKEAPPARKGGGGRQQDPNKAKYWEEREKADKAKAEHQLNVVEPRIAYANCRSHAIELVDLYIRNGALALGAENAAKRKGIIDAAVEQETKRLFDVSMKAIPTPQAPAAAASEPDALEEEADELDAVADEFEEDEIL